MIRTWLDEVVQNIIAIGIVGDAIVILTARAFNQDIYVPPEILIAFFAVLTVYGFTTYKAAQANSPKPTDTTAK